MARGLELFSFIANLLHDMARGPDRLLSFIAVVAISIKDKPKLAVFLISALMAVILKDLPWNLWIIGSALIAIAAGVLLSNLGKVKQ